MCEYDFLSLAIRNIYMYVYSQGNEPPFLLVYCSYIVYVYVIDLF